MHDRRGDGLQEAVGTVQEAVGTVQEGRAGGGGGHCTGGATGWRRGRRGGALLLSTVWSLKALHGKRDGQGRVGDGAGGLYVEVGCCVRKLRRVCLEGCGSSSGTRIPAGLGKADLTLTVGGRGVFSP